MPLVCTNLIMPVMPSVEQIRQAARQAGIDLDLIDTNLALTPEQRWRQHDAALEFALALEAARLERDAGLSQAGVLS